MQIETDAQGFITGFATVGGIEGGIDVDTIPQEVQDNPGYYRWTPEELYVYDDSKVLSISTQLALENELLEIKQWFNDNDYKVNKVVRGNWQADDPRYLEYLAEYDVKYTRKEEIENILDTEV